MKLPKVGRTICYEVRGSMGNCLARHATSHVKFPATLFAAITSLPRCAKNVEALPSCVREKRPVNSEPSRLTAREAQGSCADRRLYNPSIAFLTLLSNPRGVRSPGMWMKMPKVSAYVLLERAVVASSRLLTTGLPHPKL